MDTKRCQAADKNITESFPRQRLLRGGDGNGNMKHPHFADLWGGSLEQDRIQQGSCMFSQSRKKKDAKAHELDHDPTSPTPPENALLSEVEYPTVQARVGESAVATQRQNADEHESRVRTPLQRPSAYPPWFVFSILRSTLACGWISVCVSY